MLEPQEIYRNSYSLPPFAVCFLYIDRASSTSSIFMSYNFDLATVLLSLRSEKIVLSNTQTLNYIIKKEIILLGNKKLMII
jgi:hypothetical protein